VCVSAEALAKVDGVLGPVFGPRRFGAFGGVFELVGCRLRCVELRRLETVRWCWVEMFAREWPNVWVWCLLCASFSRSLTWAA